jgi:hypothetical protein
MVYTIKSGRWRDKKKSAKYPQVKPITVDTNKQVLQDSFPVEPPHFVQVFMACIFFVRKQMNGIRFKVVSILYKGLNPYPCTLTL